MKSLSSFRIAFKLPVIVVSLCLAVSTSIALLAYLDFRETVLDEAKKSFKVLTEERRNTLRTWLATINDDVLGMGVDPTVVTAITALNNVYGVMMDDPTRYLQQAYISENPNPVGEKDMLDQAADALPYNFRHREIHPFFRNLKDRHGYYDMFLFNLEGDLIYSVYKELDFATNFIDGPYSGSGLGQVFRQALEGTEMEVFFEDFAPYAPSNDAPASFLATPIFQADGVKVGVVAVQLPADRIAEIMNNPTGLGDTGEIYVVGPDLTARNASRFDDRHDFFDQLPPLSQVKASIIDQINVFVDVPGVTGSPVVAEVVSVDVFDSRWGIIGEVDLSEVFVPVIEIRNRMIIVSVVGAVIAGVLGWFTAHSVTAPLGRLGRGMQAVADAKFDTEIADVDRKDEIGMLAQILVAFRDRLGDAGQAEAERIVFQQKQTDVVESLSKALKALADGDLSSKIKIPFDGEYDTLRLDYNSSIKNLNETIGLVVNSAKGIRHRTNEMSTSSDELSQRTENQAATLEQTAAALDELTASVKSAASGAREIEKIVADAQMDAEDSGPVVRNAVSAMTEIEKSSDEISQIIGVIDDIAFQTNLLALNAGIEAARAGEAGRGFAVVASEVRALAQRFSDAAKQIKGLISDSTQQVERGVGLVGQAGKVLTRIVERISYISGLMTDIASGAEEQSIGLGEINVGVTQLDKVTQQNAAMVDKATTSYHALNRDAQLLSDMVARFRLSNSDTDRDSGGTALPSAVTVENMMAKYPPKTKAASTLIATAAEFPKRKLAVTDTGGLKSSGKNDLWEDF